MTISRTRTRSLRSPLAALALVAVLGTPALAFAGEVKFGTEALAVDAITAVILWFAVRRLANSMDRMRAQSARLAQFPQLSPNPVVELAADGSIASLNMAASIAVRDASAEIVELLPSEYATIARDCIATGEARQRACKRCWCIVDGIDQFDQWRFNGRGGRVLHGFSIRKHCVFHAAGMSRFGNELAEGDGVDPFQEHNMTSVSLRAIVISAAMAPSRGPRASPSPRRPTVASPTMPRPMARSRPTHCRKTGRRTSPRPRR